MPAVPEPEREFAFSEADFRSLAQLAHDYAGIALTESKRNLVYTRVSRRLRALGLSSFRDYRSFLSSNAAELESFINAISTNLTKFFREAHHFEHFSRHVVQPYAAGRGGRFRVWSAGCSTGEEPYTIAAVIRHDLGDIGHRDVRILATDIDTDVLKKAARGEYPAKSVDDVPRVYREYFQARTGRGTDTVFAEDEIRQLIAFRRLNLIDNAWPFSGKFDAIFCRNVMIYFDADTKSRLIDRFIQAIKPGGWLYIGHSESFHGAHPELQLVGRTTYRRRP